MKSYAKPLMLAAAGLAVFLAGTLALKHRTDEPGKTASAAAIPSATVATVKRATIGNTLTVAGEFLPQQEVELHAKVAGYIRKINVDIGDHVRAGEVLAVLEVPELNAQVLGADAGVRRSRDDITRAQHEVTRAQAAHAALHDGALRLQQAAKARPGLIAQQELDDAVARDLAAEAQVESAKASLSGAQQQLDISKANHTQVSALQDYSRIVAPFDGIVTWRYADTGALVQSGTSNASSMPVVKLAQANTLRLRLPVPESVAPSIRVGAPADVEVQATHEHFQAKVARFTNALDRATRTMQVEIDVPNPKYKLAPGMYANVSLEVESHANALTVPIEALRQTGDKAWVLVVNPSAKIESRQVQLGLEDASSAEVLAGLHEGEQVIVGNVSSYRAGETVHAKPRHVAEASASAERAGE